MSVTSTTPRPRATVVIPATRDARALRSSVASALGQTEQRIEVIVVGETVDELRSLVDLQEPQLVLVPCPGTGLGARLNLGVALARGAAVKLLVTPGATLDPSALARELARLDAVPGAVGALFLSSLDTAATLDVATTPALDAAIVLAGLLQRDVPALDDALLRTATLCAKGGVDATLRRALAYDLWLRLLPGSCVAAMGAPSAVRPVESAGDVFAGESVESRAEHGYALVRALGDHGLDWWRDVAGTACGVDADPAAAWLELIVLLFRSRLPEARPLARAAARRAREWGATVPAWEEIERRALAGPRTLVARAATQDAAQQASSHREANADDLSPGRDAVHELAALVRRNAGTLRAIEESNRSFAGTAPWLASEVETTRVRAEEAAALTGRTLDKLRLRHRATQASREVLERSRRVVDGWRARINGPTSERPQAMQPPVARSGPRARRWLILAAVPIDDIGGGQRSAQLARALVAAGDLVTYVARFPRHESVDLALRHELPGLELLDWDPARLRSWLAGRDELLRVLVELPEAGVVQLAREARELGARVIYDKIDNWAACTWADWYASDVERALVGLADDRVGSARLLVRQLAKDGHDAHLIPNAVDDALFRPLDDADLVTPPDQRRGEVTLVYAGSLWGDWFDWRLVCEIAERRPEWSVNLIGDPPARLPRPLPANVHLLGLKPQSALPPYLAASDVCLIPFIPSPLVDAVSPLKVFEYLAMHRPVVAEPMPELHDMPYVFTALGTDATVAAIEQAVETPAPLDALAQFRARGSWHARVHALHALVEQPTVAVVVLCYDNRDVIETCVESLLRSRGRARHEIVVVDNGSTDGSLELLDAFAARGEITLLRNPVNGCSSGRNLGVRASASEVVVFLDSDQRALHPGWLDPALAILREHADVGAVGWNAGWFHPGGGRGTIVDDLPDRGARELGRDGFRSDVAYLATSGLVVPRAVLRRTAGFDERLDPTCFEDTDLSFQIKDAGYALAYCPAIGVDHRPHATTSALGGYGEVFRRNERYFLDKWRRRPEYLFDLPR